MINNTIVNQSKNIIDEGVIYIRKRAQKLLMDSDIHSPPFIPEDMVFSQNIKKITRKDLGKQSGLLLPLGDGFEIVVNATHSFQRQNFSCAHEIAHTFFQEEKGKEIIERIKRVKGDIDSWEEYLCDIAASELLMPYKVFYKYAAEQKFMIKSIPYLSKIFNTAIVTTALRLCDINPRWNLLLFWTKNYSHQSNSISLRCKWLTYKDKKLSPKTSRYVPYPKFVGESASIYRAYASNEPTYATQKFIIGNHINKGQIWSYAFDSGPKRYVLSTIFPESYEQSL